MSPAHPGIRLPNLGIPKIAAAFAEAIFAASSQADPPRYKILDTPDHGQRRGRDHVVGFAPEDLVLVDDFFPVGEQRALFLFGWLEGVGDQDNLVQILVRASATDKLGMHVVSVGDDFGAHLRIRQDGAHGTGVPVVQAAHRVEEVGRVENSSLESFDHVFISRVGVAGLEGDSFVDAEERQFPHAFVRAPRSCW